MFGKSTAENNDPNEAHPDSSQPIHDIKISSFRRYLPQVNLNPSHLPL